MWPRNTVRYMQTCTAKYSQIQSDTCRYALLSNMHMCMYSWQEYILICTAFKQCICVCICMYAGMYLYDIHAHMHCSTWYSCYEPRYMKIQSNRCRYRYMHITYTLCICDMHSAVSCACVCAYVHCIASHTCTYITPYVCCMCFTCIHICTGRITDVPRYFSTVSLIFFNFSQMFLNITSTFLQNFLNLSQIGSNFLQLWTLHA